MSQLTWTIVSQSGKLFKVGMYHGEKSGHLLVHCNLKVMLVDFNVLETRSYSFFIEDEFCELTVEKAEGQFRYGLELNTKIDTPLNRARNSKNKRHLWQSVFFFLVLFGVAAVVALFVPDFQKNRMAKSQEKWLAESRKTTFGKITDIDSVGKKVSYTFIADNKPGNFTISFDELAKDSKLYLPISSGDDVGIVYAIHNISLHHFDQNQIPEKQKAAYIAQTAERHRALHPQLSSGFTNCLLNVVFENKGMGGLADFYYQNQTPQDNPQHNQSTYQNLINDADFKKLSREKCGE